MKNVVFQGPLDRLTSYYMTVPIRLQEQYAPQNDIVRQFSRAPPGTPQIVDGGVTATIY